MDFSYLLIGASIVGLLALLVSIFTIPNHRWICPRQQLPLNHQEVVAEIRGEQDPILVLFCPPGNWIPRTGGRYITKDIKRWRRIEG